MFWNLWFFSTSVLCTLILRLWISSVHELAKIKICLYRLTLCWFWTVLFVLFINIFGILCIALLLLWCHRISCARWGRCHWVSHIQWSKGLPSELHLWMLDKVICCRNDTKNFTLWRQVQKAIAFAKKAHEGQFRKTGDPYLTHCIHTGKILAALVPSTGKRVIILLLWSIGCHLYDLLSLLFIYCTNWWSKKWTQQRPPLSFISMNKEIVFQVVLNTTVYMSTWLTFKVVYPYSLYNLIFLWCLRVFMMKHYFLQAIDTVVAGILHDVVDDTGQSLDSIEREFDDEVAKLVAGVSRLSFINQVN